MPGGCASDRAFGLGLFLVGVYLSIKRPLINKYALSKYLKQKHELFSFIYQRFHRILPIFSIRFRKFRQLVLLSALFPSIAFRMSDK